MTPAAYPPTSGSLCGKLRALNDSVQKFNDALWPATWPSIIGEGYLGYAFCCFLQGPSSLAANDPPPNTGMRTASQLEQE